MQEQLPRITIVFVLRLDLIFKLSAETAFSSGLCIV